jgi:hypothetical protein
MPVSPAREEPVESGDIPNAPHNRKFVPKFALLGDWPVEGRSGVALMEVRELARVGGSILVRGQVRPEA